MHQILLESKQCRRTSMQCTNTDTLVSHIMETYGYLQLRAVIWNHDDAWYEQNAWHAMQLKWYKSFHVQHWSNCEINSIAVWIVCCSKYVRNHLHIRTKFQVRIYLYFFLHMFSWRFPTWINWITWRFIRFLHDYYLQFEMCSFLFVYLHFFLFCFSAWNQNEIFKMTNSHWTSC